MRIEIGRWRLEMTHRDADHLSIGFAIGGSWVNFWMGFWQMGALLAAIGLASLALNFRRKP